MAFVCTVHGYCEHDKFYCMCRKCWNPMLRKIEDRLVCCNYIRKGKSESFQYKYEIKASENTIVRGYYNLIDTSIRTNTYATGEGIIGHKSSMLTNKILIFPEKIEAGKEIILHTRNRNIVDLKIYKGDIVAEFRTNHPVYSLK